MKWQSNVDNCGNGLNGVCVLAALEEKGETGLILGVPVEKIKLCLLKGMMERHGNPLSNRPQLLGKNVE